MARARTEIQAPTAAQRATAHTILGLLCAVTMPFLAPAGLGAVWIGLALARAGHRLHAALVLAATVAAAVLVVDLSL